MLTEYSKYQYLQQKEKLQARADTVLEDITAENIVTSMEEHNRLQFRIGNLKRLIHDDNRATQADAHNWKVSPVTRIVY